MKFTLHPVVHMNKLKILFIIINLFHVFTVSRAQVVEIRKVDKSNRIDNRDYLQSKENCILFCSSIELQEIADSLTQRTNLQQNVILIQIIDLSSFIVHNTDLCNAILIKLPYELSPSITQRWIPIGWSINKVENSKSHIYAIQRSANGQCSKEEKILLFQEMFIKSLDLIEKSKNSYEYSLYSNQQLLKENSKNLTLIMSLTQRIDSLQNAFIEFNEREKSIDKNQNSIGLEWNNSLVGFNKSLNDFNLQKLNFNALSLTWKYSINSNFKIGLGYQYGETNFRTFTSYDSTSVSAQTNLGLNFTKSTIIRNLTENNSLSFNAILLNFGYIKNIGKHFSFDLSSTTNYCPKLILNTNVIDGFADYKGHFNGISETLTNISELGLESNVSLLNNEFQTTNSLIQFSVSPGIQYENERFFSRIGIGYSLLFFNQISNMQTNRSNKIGEFNSSLSTFGNFSAQTVTFSLSAGIKL